MHEVMSGHVESRALPGLVTLISRRGEVPVGVTGAHAFGQMLLEGGNERILSRTAVDLMVTDQIPPAQKAISPFFPGFWDTSGWGLGLAVTTARATIGPSPGIFGWDGGITTSWRSDPQEGMVAVLMTQVSYATEVWLDFWSLAYSAIDN